MMLRKLIRWLYRSAISGRFVTRDYADGHPETTTREAVNDDR